MQKHIVNQLEIELHTFFVWVIYICQQSLGLNNDTYVFQNVVQVAPLGQETVNIVMYIF